MNQNTSLVLLNPEQIRERVQLSNSFSKAEMLAHRSQIRDARLAKRNALATMTGSQLGVTVDKLIASKGAVIRDVRETSSSKQQKWTIIMVAKKNMSPAEILKAKAARLQKQLNKVEEELEATQKPVTA